MKMTASLFAFLLLPVLAFAQTTVAASEVIAKINRGEAVAYKNVRVEGNLDLTQLQNKKLKPNDKDENQAKIYVSTVTAPVSFSNCTFSGEVIGYFNPDANKEGFNNSWSGSSTLYNTNFEQAVRFEKCLFEGEVNFKYSAFKGLVSFAESQFRNIALFKYTQFAQGPDFSKVSFSGDVVFKYVKFPENTSFAQAAFPGEADFKYAHFNQGVNFAKASFTGFANFKYAHLNGPVNLQGLVFKGTQDFKYTQLNGQLTNLAQRPD